MISKTTDSSSTFKPLPPKISATNLQLQSYDGQPAAQLVAGPPALPQGFGEGEEIIDNTAYRQIAVVRAGNGLHADLHDFQIGSNDTALLTAIYPVHLRPRLHRRAGERRRHLTASSRKSTWRQGSCAANGTRSTTSPSPTPTPSSPPARPEPRSRFDFSHQ